MHLAASSCFSESKYFLCTPEISSLVFVHERWITLGKVSLCLCVRYSFSWYLATCFNGVYIVFAALLSYVWFSTHLFLKMAMLCKLSLVSLLFDRNNKKVECTESIMVVVVEWMALLLLCLLYSTRCFFHYIIIIRWLSCCVYVCCYTKQNNIFHKIPFSSTLSSEIAAASFVSLKERKSR